MDSDSIKKKLSSVANLPKDVTLGLPVITMTGQVEMSIENYRSIIEYTEILIRVQSKSGQIKIKGSHLQIEYYTNDEMKITGRIKSVEYM